jgi:hypothetical protein
MFIQMSKCFGSRSKPKFRTILNLFFKFYFSMNYVWRLQKYWPPTPSHPASVSSPRTKGGGYTPGGEGGGGSIFLKTPDTVLYSTYVSTLASCNYGRNNLWWGWGKERQGGSIFWGFLIPSKNYTGPGLGKCLCLGECTAKVQKIGQFASKLVSETAVKNP